jgi:hypothetical protein
MTDHFTGYMSDVKVTRGAAKYRTTSDIILRFKILWAAIKNLFTGKGVWLSGNMHVSIDPPGMTTGVWVQSPVSAPWQYWSVTFDGKKAVGYIDGEKVDE